MSIETDYDPETAASLEAELKRFPGDCCYDTQLKKIVYVSEEAALRAYMVFQREEMDRHKWVESEKAHCDLRDRSLVEWVYKHSAAFSRYWHRTHVFIPSQKESDPP